MPNAVVTLKKGAGRTLKQGGPWIYDNEIEYPDARAECVGIPEESHG